jgi:imidazolonepropionase-like amidohydrolase
MKLQPHSLVASLLTLTLLAGTASAQRTVIHAGTLIDGRSGRVSEMRSIVVERDRIARIESGFIEPDSEDRLVDLKQHTVMPGLIDMHVHLADQQSADSYEERFRLDPTDYVLRRVRYAERTLMAGFTTVRDLGANDGLIAGESVTERLWSSRHKRSRPNAKSETPTPRRASCRTRRTRIDNSTRALA